MNIVVEGADGAGKSTLVDYIARSLNRGVVTSKGPCKTQQEFDDRVRMFLSCEGVVFDRHCIVSERIYGNARGYTHLLQMVEDAFYWASPALFIYCRNPDGFLTDHVAKKHDTPEHLTMVSEKHTLIRNAYDEWAMRHAHIIYRKGDDKARVLSFLQGALHT